MSVVVIVEKHTAVIAIVLLSSVLSKAYLPVCPVTLLAYPKLEVRALIEEWLKSIIRDGYIVLYAIGHLLLKL